MCVIQKQILECVVKDTHFDSDTFIKLNEKCYHIFFIYLVGPNYYYFFFHKDLGQKKIMIFFYIFFAVYIVL